MTMKLNIEARKMKLFGLAAVSAIAASLAGIPAAQAGECPPDKVGVDVTKPGATAPSGVTDEVIASIDLDESYPQLGNGLFRMRQLVIQPGGEVPWHQHGGRPANIYVVSGEMTEYRSTCAVPITHKAGEVTAESGDLSHWWRNNSSKPAVLISADILAVEMMDGNADHDM